MRTHRTRRAAGDRRTSASQPQVGDRHRRECRGVLSSVLTSLSGGQPAALLRDYLDNNKTGKDVLHQAVVEVNEEGSEAAGATSVRFGRRTMLPKAKLVKVMKFDKPFLFIIEDVVHEVPLFFGRVMDVRSLMPLSVPR